MAKLHIICGNCGISDMFEYGIVEEVSPERYKWK